jgi:Ran GTPase-activating protein (RanGAP) involved in mRNA processing and transport
LKNVLDLHLTNLTKESLINDTIKTLELAEGISTKKIFLNNHKLGDNVIVELSNVLSSKKYSGIESINLWNVDMSEIGCIALAESLKNCPNIRKLDLGANKIGDKGCFALADWLSNHTTLCEFIFGSNEIGDEGCIALSNSFNENVIAKLNLFGNNITDVGFLELSKTLKNQTYIEKLDISFNKFGHSSIENFKDSLIDKRYFREFNINSNDKDLKLSCSGTWNLITDDFKNNEQREGFPHVRIRDRYEYFDR